MHGWGRGNNKDWEGYNGVAGQQNNNHKLSLYKKQISQQIIFTQKKQQIKFFSIKFELLYVASLIFFVIWILISIWMKYPARKNSIYHIQCCLNSSLKFSSSPMQNVFFKKMFWFFSHLDQALSFNNFINKITRWGRISQKNKLKHGIVLSTILCRVVTNSFELNSIGKVSSRCIHKLWATQWSSLSSWRTEIILYIYNHY